MPTKSNYNRRLKFLTEEVKRGEDVLDVGFGGAHIMTLLSKNGANCTGIEIDRELVNKASNLGFNVKLAGAEKLPFDDESFDTIICAVALPYTDEEIAIKEWQRVLKSTGKVILTTHGLGFGLQRLLSFEKQSYYGFRMLLNTLIYSYSGKRLKGHWGNTLCQSRSFLKKRYKRMKLELIEELVDGTFWGLPIYIGHKLIKL